MVTFLALSWLVLLVTVAIAGILWNAVRAVVPPWREQMNQISEHGLRLWQRHLFVPVVCALVATFGYFVYVSSQGNHGSISGDEVEVGDGIPPNAR